MSHSGVGPRGVAGHDPVVAADRRRARLLARILDAAPRLHELREPAAVLAEAEQILLSVFPDCRYLCLLASNHGHDLRVEERIIRGNYPADETAARIACCDLVVRSGRAAFEAELDLAHEHIGACVPIPVGNSVGGALLVDSLPTAFASSDELNGTLRHLATQLGLALRCVADIRARRADMRILATETGQSLNDTSLSLTDAKRAFEHWLICTRLKESRGNIAAAARSLQMDRGQLSRLVKRHELKARSFRS